MEAGAGLDLEEEGSAAGEAGVAADEAASAVVAGAEAAEGSEAAAAAKAVKVEGEGRAEVAWGAGVDSARAVAAEGARGTVAAEMEEADLGACVRRGARAVQLSGNLLARRAEKGPARIG